MSSNKRARLNHPVYYKVTNKRENINGLQLQDGLNVIPTIDKTSLNFRNSPTEFKFTNLEHIHHHYYEGIWIREGIQT